MGTEASVIGLHLGDGVLRHPRNPFTRTCADPRIVYPLAFEYASAFGKHLGLDAAWIAGLSRAPLARWSAADQDPGEKALELRWFRFDPAGALADPRNSFLVERRQAGERDQWGVLLAGMSPQNTDDGRVYLSQPRLRVVFSMFERDKGRFVRFSGMSVARGQSGAAGAPPVGPIPRRPDVKDSVEILADVFTLDPASSGDEDTLPARAPGRPSETLRPFRSSVSLGTLPVKAERALLSNACVHVFNSALVEPQLPEQCAKEIEVVRTAQGWRARSGEPRTNDFAAVSAFYHCNALFESMRAWGLDPAAHFRCAELPVGIEYRSELDRASGGIVRNADVRWSSPAGLDRPGRILMRFGLADLTIPPSEAPLGLACDVRWFWHELSHVLLMAGVGERELRFCHSAGDALAAIACDPDSRFAGAGWRGRTFPWVSLDRRHDRAASEGWAWGGALDREDDAYWQEQILSTSLFRLYRCLGGGSPDAAARVAAADYTCYLIVQAIGLLGPAAVVHAASADHFVSALIDVDIGTSVFQARNGRRRVGGTAHKAVRWAFEQQGLYTAPGRVASGPGEPEAVDLLIESPLHGGYALDSALPAYEIRVSKPKAQKANTVSVLVANRGATTAEKTKVTLWAAKASLAQEFKPNDARWKKIDDRYQDIPARKANGSSDVVRLTYQWKPEAPGRYLLLAAATCERDRSIIDPQTELSCARSGAPPSQLVAGDNNLGLVDVEVT